MNKKIYKPQKDTTRLDHSKTKITDAMNISILPHPTTIESYEEIIPGITKTLANLFVKEQEHRHRMEQQALKNLTILSKFGQIVTIIFTVMIIFFTIYAMSFEKNIPLGITICVCGFAFLSISSVIGKKSLPKYEKSDQNLSIMNVMIAVSILIASVAVAVAAASYVTAAVICISGFAFLTIINVGYCNKKHHHDGGEKIKNEV